MTDEAKRERVREILMEFKKSQDGFISMEEDAFDEATDSLLAIVGREAPEPETTMVEKMAKAHYEFSDDDYTWDGLSRPHYQRELMRAMKAALAVMLKDAEVTFYRKGFSDQPRAALLTITGLTEYEYDEIMELTNE